MNTATRNIIISSFVVSCLFFSGCQKPVSSETENNNFTRFTNELFCQEVSSNTINLHYTLQDPSLYDLEHTKISYGELSTDPINARASIENYQSVLHSFHRKNLSSENQLTYDILDSYLETASIGSKYMLYQEPLSPVSGIQAQLPVLLSEYQFYTASDVDTYLTLLTDTNTYFQSIIEFEQAKADAGLFMSDDQADEIISQCQSFLDMGDSNYLYTTFTERINALSDLSSEEKEDYNTKNKEAIETNIFPSYNFLIESLESLKGSGLNEKGLCYLPQGSFYYEYLIRETAGLSESIPELQELTKAQMLDDLNAMEEIIFPTGTEDSPSVLDLASPSSLLNDLQSKITASFPSIPTVNTNIKYVPEAMEEYLSPAFYMIPAIDNYSENVIYINQGQVLTGLNLYTTLAHEGYPGHLYQTVYFHSKNPDPIRSLLDFGGYVEGWATYAEMMSYYMAPLSSQEAGLLQKNSSLILGLYAYADMGIHYDGWSLNEMSNFFQTYGISDTNTLESIYRLIIDSPGNYVKYYLGYVKFYTLKQEIAASLGKSFSQKAFHEAVLEVGPAPFDIVETYVEDALLPDT